MPSVTSFVSRLGLLAVLAQSALAQDDNPCKSYGMDFQDGGNYFQNSNSTDPFTFVSQFDGCMADHANNLLVDPNGEQYLCSDTNLTPDDTDQMAICPKNKEQLWSGAWSVLIISNNGKAQPIAYQRDFSLSVGPQLTSTYTPTVTATYPLTLVVNQTSTTTGTSTITTNTTTTQPSTTIKPTITVTPAKVTVTTTRTLFTLRLTKPTLTIAQVTKIVTATCKLPTKQASADPTATITPTIAGVTAAALASPAAKAKFRRVPGGGIEFGNKETFLRERAARLAEMQELEKRAPDPQPLVVTETNASLFVTAISTTTVATTTATITTDVTVSTTTTLTHTIYSGRTTMSVVTITAPTPTKTRTNYAIVTSWSMKTYTTTVTVTSKTSPAASVTACIRHGGVMQ